MRKKEFYPSNFALFWESWDFLNSFETKAPDPLCRVGWAFFYTIGTPEQYAALRVQAMQHEQQCQADRQAAA